MILIITLSVLVSAEWSSPLNGDSRFSERFVLSHPRYKAEYSLEAAP